MRSLAVVASFMIAACGPGKAPDVRLSNAWARPAEAGKTVTVAYLTIANAGGADRLVAVSSPVGDASIHSTRVDGGVMRMRPVEAITMGAGSTIELKPGGLHIMVTGLKQPLAEGDGVPLRLQFERSGEKRVEAAVRSASPAKDTR